MWFLKFLRRRKGKSNGLFKWVILGLAFLFLVVVIVIWSTSSNRIAKLIIKSQTQKVFDNVQREIGDSLDQDLGDKYPLQDKVGNEIKYGNGERGNGINLLLINNIKTEGYVKELLSLYADSEAGKLNDYKYHFSVEGLLGIQKNETGAYFGNIVKTYIPFDEKSRTIYWGKNYKNIPGDALKVRQLNENVINGAPPGGGAPYRDANKLPYTINGINPLVNGVVSNSDNDNPSRDINVFQVNRKSFGNTGSGSVPPAKISGYGITGRRTKSDAYYLPDALTYVDMEFTHIIEKYGLDPKDRKLAEVAYSLVHNGGEYSWCWDGGFGVSFKVAGSKLKSADSAKEEYGKHTVVIPRDIVNGIKNSKTDLREVVAATGALGRAAGAFLLVQQGYYLSPKAYDILTSGKSYSTASPKAWQAVTGEKVSLEQLKAKLKNYVKTVKDVYPDYITSESTFKDVYGFSFDFHEKANGAIWKLDSATSSAYKNKVAGKDPRVLHVANTIHVGHMLNTAGGGQYVYADMLKYAGVNIDPTNPDSYMDKLENEYKPPSTEFSQIMKDIGANTSNQLIYDMLKAGYDKSGFWYYLGGKAKPVAQENFNLHKSYTTIGGNFTGAPGRETRQKYFAWLYRTKDGTAPSAKQPNSNLVNYGNYLFDCSSFTAYAYNQAVWPKVGGNKLVDSAKSQLRSSLLHTIPKSDLRTGDILVTGEHVFFYVSKNTGNATTTDTTVTKIEVEQTVRAGYHWVLEAPTSNKKVGLRVRSSSSLADYTARRFNAFK